MPIAWRNLYRRSFIILHGFKRTVEVAFRRHDLHRITQHKLVLHRNLRPVAAAFTGEFSNKLLALGDGETLLIVLIAVVRMTAQETFGVTAVRQSFQRLQQCRIKRFTRSGIINGAAINLGGARAVVERFSTAFNFSECTPIWLRRSTCATARRSLES